MDNTLEAKGQLLGLAHGSLQDPGHGLRRPECTQGCDTYTSLPGGDLRFLGAELLAWLCMRLLPEGNWLRCRGSSE